MVRVSLRMAVGRVWGWRVGSQRAALLLACVPLPSLLKAMPSILVLQLIGDRRSFCSCWPVAAWAFTGDHERAAQQHKAGQGCIALLWPRGEEQRSSSLLAPPPRTACTPTSPYWLPTAPGVQIWRAAQPRASPLGHAATAVLATACGVGPRRRSAAQAAGIVSDASARATSLSRNAPLCNLYHYL